MSDDESCGLARRPALGVGACSGSKNTEPTQRFSALQQQLLCAAIHFFHRHIRSDDDVLQRMEGNSMFRLFFEVQYHNKPDLNRIFPDSVHDCSALHVCSFILSILHQGIFSVSAFIVSVIYLSRFKESAHITLHACTWRPLFLTSLLLADKMWEDKPVRNSSLAKLFPVLSNLELNKMESDFLLEISFNVLVKPDLFCSFCEKLLAESIHVEITRCVNNSEYAATLQADQGEQAGATPPSLMDGDAAGQVPLDGAIGFNSGDKVLIGGSAAARPKHSSSNEHVQAQHPQRATIGGHQQRHGQVPVVWMENGASGSAPAGHGPEGLVPRSQSAGPTSAGSRRSEGTTRPASSAAAPTPYLHAQLASLRQNMVASSAAAAAGPPMAKPLVQQPSRSVSVNPLNRNDSTKKHPLGKPEEVHEKVNRPGHHPVTSSAYSAAQQQPLRRSLPAKTSNSAYVPLARAPSAGGNASAMVPAAAASTPSHSGHIGTGPPGSTQDIHQPRENSGGCSITVGALPDGRPAQQSPRSPVGVQPVHLPHEQHHSLRPNTQGHTVQHSRVAQHMQGQGPRIATPPVPTSSHSVPPSQGQSMQKAQQQRGVSPAGTVQQHSQGAQPTRASSAPRVAGIAQHHVVPPGGGGGSNLRTTSQPMGTATHQRQAPGAYGLPGSPNPTSPGLVAGQPQPHHQQHPHYGGQPSQMVFPANAQQGSPAAPRGTSPVPTQVGGGLAMNMARGAVSHGAGHARNPSPIGLAAPSSPAGNVQFSQMPFGSVTAAVGGPRQDALGGTTRGRSPPPTIAPGAAPPGMRAPRAVTPSSIVKGISQGMNPAMIQQRGSLGGGAMTMHRQGLA